MPRPFILEIPYIPNPAFSEEESKIFSVEGPGTDKIFQNISQLTTKSVSFLASAALTDEEKSFTARYTFSSPDTRVALLAEETFKRISVSPEHEDLVKKLFEAHSRLPAAYRTRILTLLTKSNTASTVSQRIINVVTDHYPLAVRARTRMKKVDDTPRWQEV